MVTGARSFFHLDLRYEIVPLWHVSQKALLSGQSPYWIDGEHCGHPALLRQEVALFYPLTAPLLATGAPAHRLADLFSLFHFWLAGFAAFLLLQYLAADGLSSLFGGVAWMLSARMVQSAIWPNAVAASALLPLLLLGLLRIGRGERRSGVLYVSISGGLAVLVFRPQILVGAVPLLLATATAALLLSRRRARALADISRSALLALALGAPALVPALALYPLSSRAGGLERQERDLLPITRGNVDLVFLPVEGSNRWPEASAYPGAATVVLAVVGLALAIRRDSSVSRVVFLAVAGGGLLGLIFAFGERGPYGLVADLPVFREFRIPARFLVSWSLALAICSGLALSALRTRIPPRLHRTVAASALLLLCIDLIGHARRTAPTSPSEVYEIEPAIVEALRKRLTPDEAGFPRRFWTPVRPVNFPAYPDREKVWAARRLEPLSFGLGMRFGLEAVQGHVGPTLLASEALLGNVTRRTAELVGAGCFVRWLPPPRPFTPQGSPVPPQMAVEFFQSLPRAYVVPKTVSVPSARAVQALLSVDPLDTAIVENSAPLRRKAGWTTGRGRVRLLSRAPGRVEMSATLPDEGVLVLAQSFENGWSATIDGRPEPVFRANAAFLGVRVPRGDHVVRFDYRPRGLSAGFGGAGLGLFALAFFARRLAAQDGEPG